VSKYYNQEAGFRWLEHYASFILKCYKRIMTVCLFNTAVQLEHRVRQYLSSLTIYHRLTSVNSAITAVLAVKLSMEKQ